MGHHRVASSILFLIASLLQAASAGEPTGDVDAIDGVAARFESPDEFHFVRPGQESEVGVRVVNLVEVQREVEVRIHVQAFSGNTLSADASLELAPTSDTLLPIPNALMGGPGIKWISYRLKVGDQVGPMHNAAFVYGRPYEFKPGPPRPGAVLLSLANGAAGLGEKECRAAARCGFRGVRFNPQWPNVQSGPGAFRWDAADERMALYRTHGFVVQMLLHGTPIWAADVPEGFTGRHYERPPRPDAWREYVAAVAERYGKDAGAWEIWNEPDIGFFTGTVDEYLAMLRAAAEEIRRHAPEATVMTGGFTSLDHHAAKPGMLKRVLSEAPEAFSMLAYHKHGTFAEFREEIEGRVEPLLRECLKQPVPLYFTETGMDTRQGERFQAETAIKKAAYAFSRGAPATTWFNVTDRAGGEDARKPGETYGLFTRDWHPKAVAAAWNVFAGLTDGKAFAATHVADGEQFAFSFRDRRDETVVFWKEQAAVREPVLLLQTNAAAATAVDLMGNRRRIPVNGRFVILTPEETPSYLVLEGTGAPARRGKALLTVADSGRFYPGDGGLPIIELHNPAPRELIAQCTVSFPDRPDAGEKTSTGVIGGTGTLVAEYPPGFPTATLPAFGSTVPVRVRYGFRGTPWEGDITLDLRAAGIPLTGTESAGETLLVLDSLAQVVNEADADPGHVGSLWQGTADASATIRLSGNAEALHIRADIRDDTHTDASPPPGLAGDGVRVLLATRSGDLLADLFLAEIAGAPAWALLHPAGADLPPATFAAAATRDEARLHLSATLPFERLGITPDMLREGVRLNVMLTDRDGDGPGCRLQAAPGDARGATGCQAWPVLCLPDPAPGAGAPADHQ